MSENFGFLPKFKTRSHAGLWSALALVSLISAEAPAEVIDPVNNERLSIVEVRHANRAAYTPRQPPEILINNPAGTGMMVLKPDQKHRFLPATSTLVQLRHNQAPAYSLTGSLPLPSGKHQILEVPALEFSWLDGSFNVQVGPIPYAYVKESSKAGPFLKFSLLQAPGAQPQQAFGVLPGSYEYSYFIGSPIAGTAGGGTTNWGKSTSLQLMSSDVPERSIVKFHNLEKRMFPDASIPSCSGSPVYVWGGNPGLSSTDFIEAYNVPVNTTQPSHEIRFYEHVAGKALNYFAQFGSIQVRIQVGTWRQQDIDVKRLDVNHVKVVREDQSEYIAPTTYEVHYKNADGRFVRYELSYSGCGTRLSSFTAPSGLYLPKGEYQVFVNYKTAEGPKTKKYDVTL